MLWGATKVLAWRNYIILRLSKSICSKTTVFSSVDLESQIFILVSTHFVYSSTFNLFMFKKLFFNVSGGEVFIDWSSIEIATQRITLLICGSDLYPSNYTNSLEKKVEEVKNETFFCVCVCVCVCKCRMLLRLLRLKDNCPALLCCFQAPTFRLNGSLLLRWICCLLESVKQRKSRQSVSPPHTTT